VYPHIWVLNTLPFIGAKERSINMIDIILDKASPVQFATFIIAIIVFLISCIRIKKSPRNIWLRLPVSVLMLHTIIFYSDIILHNNGLYLFGIEHTFTPWSAVLRFQTLATFAVIEVYGWWAEGKQWLS